MLRKPAWSNTAVFVWAMACLMVLCCTASSLSSASASASEASLGSSAAGPGPASVQVREPASAQPAADGASVVRLGRAEFVASAAPAPPAQGWTTVSLPDSWRQSRPSTSGYGWYRLRVAFVDRPTRPLALYVRHVSLAAEFWLNGSLLNPGVRFDAPDGRMGSDMGDEPILLTLPAGLFHAGNNEFDVRLQGDARIRSGLSDLFLGPPEAFDNDWQMRHIAQVVVPYIVLVVMGGAGCFVIAHLWRRREPHIIQLGAVIATLAVASYLSVSMPLSRVDQIVLRVIVTTLEFWPLCIVGYRMSGVRIRGFAWAQHGLPVLTIAIALGAWVTGHASDKLWFIVWPLMVLRMTVAGLLLRRAWLDRSVKLGLLALTAGLWLVTTAQSLALPTDWFAWDTIRLSTVGVVPFCIVLLFLFAERFILDHEEAIEQQRAAVAAERGRILQDMHDGMGAHLITALRLARREDVDRVDLARSIEESLQDLRLIIDSLDLSDRDLLPLLGNLRFRLEPRLNALGIRLVWDVELPLPELDYLSPESALSILRVVQEAINNAIQHGRPATLRIAVRAEADRVLVEVSDDGIGFEPRPGSGSRGSRGLSGMRMRAEKLGAELVIASDSDGTRVSLRLPVVATQPVAPQRIP